MDVSSGPTRGLGYLGRREKEVFRQVPDSEGWHAEYQRCICSLLFSLLALSFAMVPVLLDMVFPFVNKVAFCSGLFFTPLDFCSALLHPRPSPLI